MVGRARMKDEMQCLRDRVEELENLLGLRIEPPRAIPGVRGIGWKLIGLLLRHPMVGREFAFRALYGDRPEIDQPLDLRIIDINICRLRVALRPYKVAIQCEIGTGYFLDEKNKTRLAALVRGRRPKHSIDGRERRNPCATDQTLARRELGVGTSASVVVAPKHMASAKCSGTHQNHQRGAS